MKAARFVLKIVALSLTIAAAACAVIAYWDKLVEVGTCASNRIHPKACAKDCEEYADYEE